MPDPEQQARVGPRRRVAAFGVHIFTALGAGLALLALMAASERQWSLMFAWLGLALAVDAIDGVLARRLAVRSVVPRWSGEVLDLVVDMLTWVFVPAYAIVTGGLLPQLLAVPLGLAIAITSALYFADARMKTADNFFRGFPGAWNVVAFFLFLLRPNPWLAAAVVLALCVLTFMPVRFVHPFRVTAHRGLTLALLATGSLLAIVALARNLEPGPYVTVPLSGICLYFLAAGLLLARETTPKDTHA